MPSVYPDNIVTLRTWHLCDPYALQRQPPLLREFFAATIHNQNTRHTGVPRRVNAVTP